MGFTLKAGLSGHAERLRRRPLLVGSMDSFYSVPTGDHGTGVTAAGGSDKKPTAEERNTRAAENFEAAGRRVSGRVPQKGHAGEATGEEF